MMTAKYYPFFLVPQKYTDLKKNKNLKDNKKKYINHKKQYHDSLLLDNLIDKYKQLNNYNIICIINIFNSLIYFLLINCFIFKLIPYNLFSYLSLFLFLPLVINSFIYKKVKLDTYIKELIKSKNNSYSLNFFENNILTSTAFFNSIDPLNYDFDEPDNVKEGLSEKFFLVYLNELFADTNYKVIRNTKFYNGKNFYHPDYLIVNRLNNKYLIDLEIDEPYSTNNDGLKIPVHCIDYKKEHTRDFFLSTLIFLRSDLLKFR